MTADVPTTLAISDEAVGSLAAVIREAMMTPYQDGHGGWLFRSSSAEEIAASVLVALPHLAQPSDEAVEARTRVLAYLDGLDGFYGDDEQPDDVVDTVDGGHESPPLRLSDLRAALAQSSGRGADHAGEVVRAHIAAVLERHSEGEPVELILHYDSDIECQQCSDGDGHLVPVCNGCYPTWEDVPGHSVWPCIEAREAVALRDALAADERPGR